MHAVRCESIKIGVVGLGTVGMGVVQALRRNRSHMRARYGVDLEISRVAEINLRQIRAARLPKPCVTRDYRDLLNDPGIGIIAELVGGTAVARKVVTEALNAGKHVVTANKALLAEHWHSVFALARRKGRAVRFESSVMAGVPVIRGIQEGLAGNVICSILGILNGTSNFIVTRMADREMEFRQALEEARQRGFCEADASLDVDGYDAAQKLAILGSIAFGRRLPPEKIFREGIGHIERGDLKEALEEFGYVIRPLAILKKDGPVVEARVHPTFVPRTHRLASVENEFNAVLVNTGTAGPVMFAGKGAGKKPAASGVISDIIALARAIQQKGNHGVLAPPPTESRQLRVMPINQVRSKFYLRFCVVDQPRVLAFISGALGKHGVSIASCHQRGRSERGPVRVVMITHEAREGALRRALADIDGNRRIVKRKTVAIRIEE